MKNALRPARILSFFAALAFLMAIPASLRAGTPAALPFQTNLPAAVAKEVPSKIKIKIIIIIIIKKGVAEVADIRPAEPGKPLASNQILAEAELVGGQLQLKALQGKFADAQPTHLAFTQAFTLSNDVASRLQATGPVVVKPTRIAYKVNQLGNFEIQD